MNRVTALGWTLGGPRASGRPKTTWRKTVEKERNKAKRKKWKAAMAAERRRESEV